MKLLLRIAWRSHRTQPLLALLAIAGIALGVTVSTAISLANSAAKQAFDQSITGVVGRATHHVVGGSAGFSETVYPLIRQTALLHGGAAAPIVEAEIMVQASAAVAAAVPGASQRRVARLLGVDPFAEAPFRGATGALQQGRAFPLDRLLTEAGTVILSRATAVTLGLPGDTPQAQAPGGFLSIRYGTHERQLRVLATVDDGGDALTRASNILVVDIATAQEVLGRIGILDRIDVQLPNAAAIAAVTALLPRGTELVPANKRADSLRQMTAAFHTNLTSLGLIALVVGMFLIINTASFAVVRRRGLFARMRAHGVTPGQILGLVLSEAVVAGAVASVIGVVAGIALARVLVDLVTRTIGDLYAAIPPTTVSVEPAIVLQGLLLGIGATVLAAAIPAREAATTRPSLALLTTQPERQLRRVLPWLVGIGGVLGLTSGAILWGMPPTITYGFLGLGCGLIGAAVLVPPILVPCVWLLSLPLRRTGFTSPVGVLAARSVGAHLSRTGLAVAALAVACAAALGMSLMVSSFRLALADWLATTIAADVYVSPPTTVAARAGAAPLDAELVTRLVSVPGITEVQPKRDAQATVIIRGQTSTAQLAAFSVPPERRSTFIARPEFSSPAASAAAWASYDAGGVIITEPFATHRNLAIDDQLTLRTPLGDRTVTVVAVVVDYSSDQGCVYVDLQQYRAWFGDQEISALGLRISPTTTPDEVIADLRTMAGDRPLAIIAGEKMKAASLTVFDQTFAITGVIRWMAAGVAVLGLIAALAAVQLERARTTARLRAIGLTPVGVFGVALGECLYTGLAAGLLAVPLGVGLAAGLTHVINRRSFGWSMELVIDPWQLVLTVALAAGAALCAGVLPAWRASRRPIAEALHAD